MDTLAGFFSTDMPYGDIVLRLALAALCGAAIGLERELRERAAGLRTHMLIALAAAVFTVMTFELAALAEDLGDASRADTLRIIDAVTAGVAFLGAGAIIKGTGAVHGLTTAAGMWLAGAIGVAAGAGFFGIALLATLMGVATVVLVGLLERRALGKGARGAAAKEAEDDGPGL